MNIIITGASRGIGFETAKLFSEDKSNKIICVSRTKYSGPTPNKNIFSIEFDLQKVNIEKDLLPQIKKYFSTLDLLINNAGTLVNKPFENITDNEWEAVFDVNLFAPVKLTKALIPLMAPPLSPAQDAKSLSSGEGFRVRPHILNISSMGGFQGSSKFPGLTAYSASKGALAILTECLAVELAEKNIRVNCLCPGGVQTEMFETAFPGAQAAMTAKDMAEKIVAFCTEAKHRSTTGKIIPVSIATP